MFPSGRQLLLQAENERERNEWIAHINYASAFKTAGIRMRSPFAFAQPIQHEDTGSKNMVHKSIEADEHGCLINDHMVSSPSSLDQQTPHLDPVSSAKSRARIVEAKIRDFEDKLASATSQVDSQKRLLRNLAILTHFRSLLASDCRLRSLL